MKKKNRFSFWKISLWLAGINLFWLILALVMIKYVKFPYQTWNPQSFNTPFFLLRMGVSLVFQCFYYYFALNWYYRLIARRASLKRFALASLLLFIACITYAGLNDLTIQKEELKVVLDISLKAFAYGISGLFHILTALAIAAIARQLDEKRDQAENQRVLEQRSSRLEREKLQADYLFLKAQINPHFLHNTLNFLYARALPLSPELSEGILTLSEIMRYSLDHREEEDGKVLLTRELEHVHNVIRLQQLRFGHSLQVRFVLKGDPAGLRILPFILITLVENAFKHGDLRDPDNPAKIELDVSGPGSLHFICSNRKKGGPKELSTGIGLDNSRRRLELTYGENYSLYIKDQLDFFTVDLTITL
ncbi:MAG TPA: histidine kinase [Puia sp.]|jgi:hypothetical protein|nr:histidine kinase [Puia sp.]